MFVKARFHDQHAHTVALFRSAGLLGHVFKFLVEPRPSKRARGEQGSYCALQQTRGVTRHGVDFEIDVVARPQARRRSSPVSVCGMISTVKVSPSTALTVSETPSSATEPLGAMKRASSAGARSVKRAISVMSSRVTTLASPSTWPATRWPPSSSPNLSERSRLTCAAVPPAADGGDAQRLGRGVDRKPGAAILFAGADHRHADAGTGDRGALDQFGARIAAEDGDAVQIVGARLDRPHLAHVGDDAGEHQARS